ncbi:hypothetical protein NLI96_g9862 [Meripilus lineatus]|uniref:Tyrosine specific protein phosphatases domain-containing protein n=1 Tax=Meripilus lineatus TaxID=2056292 RepID=A0AAD5YCI8_9APHY|nr:hypothetical protein NLI96_g9862 [Physisporinus lineatus]
MEFKVYRGCIALLGPDIDQIADKAVRSLHDSGQHPSFHPTQKPYHITIASKNELRSRDPSSSPAELIPQLQQLLGIDPIRVHSLGIGRHSDSDTPRVFFIVCIWAKGQHLRKHLGLPPKDFHITLSDQDVHDVDKGVSTLFTDEFPSVPSAELLDHLIFTLHLMCHYELAQEYATKLCLQHPGKEKGFLRLGDAALKLQEYKTAMLSFARAHDLCSNGDGDALRDYCLSKIAVCANETEWGLVLTEQEIEQLPRELFPLLLGPWSPELRTKLSELDFTPTMRREPREHLYVHPRKLNDGPHNFHSLPRFFRWLVPFHIALMSTPRNSIDIAALESDALGIRHILTLTEETPLKEEWFVSRNIKNTFLPIPNYHPPTIEQIDLIMRIINEEENLPILIHCGGGKGRAGTVAACYVAAFGFAKIPFKPPSAPVMAAADAVSALRAIRPGSVETHQQEEFVSKWCSTIWKRRSAFPEYVPEPPDCPLEILEGKLQPESNLYMLVGLPGSGKTWLSRSLIARNPKIWAWVSQDESRSKSACENQVGQFKGRGKMIMDKCNTSRSVRRGWLNLAAHWSVLPVCIWLDYDRDLCVSRAQRRAGHPTLPPGGRVRKAVEQMNRVFEKPEMSEGFGAVVRVGSFAAAQELVEKLSPPVGLFKFPRTEHLINLGAASPDDLVSVNDDLASLGFGISRDGNGNNQGQIVVTEKVDGANMGFSLSSDRSKIIVQNRSHYVNPTSHEQFKKLGGWVELHREGLYKILDRDAYFPQRYVLFGEWMAATHSVSYTKLPDWFMGFDLFDRSTESWADRESLEKLLEGTGIKMVPLLYQGLTITEAELRKMVQTESKFTDGKLEGVYVKWEKEGKVVRRGKVVRGDFIAGNEHWTKGDIRRNQLVRESG